MTKEQYLFWGLLLFFYVFFHIKDNYWGKIKYRHTDKKLIKKAKKHRARHRKNIMKKRREKTK